MRKKQKSREETEEKASRGRQNEESSGSSQKTTPKTIAVEIDTSQKRVFSLSRRLGWLVMRKRLFGLAGSIISLCIITGLGWVFGAELAVTGALPKLADTRRFFTKADGGAGIIYPVVRDGENIVQLPADGSIRVLGIIILVLSGLKLAGILLGYFSEQRKIRQILSPINEIAMQADRLSRLSFTEDKYQLIEEAITRIQPQDAETLSLKDDDLAGVEAAMNNLLKRVRDTYRQQARFVNDASHELRTPIAVIQGYANMLLRWGKQDEKILDESVTAISHETEHMKKLVEQLLFLARGDSGKTVVRPEQFSVKELMEEIYEESFMIDEHHRYRLSDSQDASDTLLVADRGLIKQAVRILIDNAAKFTNEGEEIRLFWGRNDSREVFIGVQDNGIGMEEKDVEHVFERFYRSDEVRGYQGTGLGLSIAKWIVDKHKGHFEILSRPGMGTRIVILLPAGEALPAEAS